ncbi:MAG TPA: tetratricopeptide repeat protein [Chthoniobacteraceae bacterium]|nr:tetratricopeptide repeat protein [Chthoniobacteraceae bacterium]
MQKRVLFFTLVLASAATLPPAANAAERDNPGGAASGAEVVADTSAAAQLRQAEELENSGDLKGALAVYRRVADSETKSSVTAKAQMKTGDLYLAFGKSEAAFKAYGKYLADHPEGQDFEAAVEAQFRIANSFLEGERRRVFGIKTFSSMQRAEEMFGDIVKNAPFSKMAPMAQFNIGRAREKQNKLPEAIEAYQVVVDKYPADEIASDAQYQIGYIHQSIARDGSYDDLARQKAREAYEDFLMRYPQSEKVSQAGENLESLSSEDLLKTFNVARFYEKTGNYKAAVIYYDEVIQMGGGTPEAEQAQTRLDHLRETVSEDLLQAGPERTETGERAKERRKLQAQVETASRPDYVGPPAPKVPDEVAPAGPQLRAPRGAVEPMLPSGEGLSPEEEALIPNP